MGEALWTLLVFAMYWAAYGDANPQPLYAGLAVLQGVGCFYIARHRGRSGWWALLGWLPILCLGLPFFLPPKALTGVPRSTLALRIGVGVCVMVAAVGVIAVRRNRTDTEPSRPDEWAPRSAAGMRLTAPFEFVPVPQSLDALPAEARATVEAIDIVTGENMPGTFVATVLRRTVRSQYTPDLDGYLKDTLNDQARHLGDANPRITVNSARVGHLEARRGEALVAVRDRTVHLDALATFHGRTTWLVLLSYQGDAASADARRLMSSIEVVEPAPR